MAHAVVRAELPCGSAARHYCHEASAANIGSVGGRRTWNLGQPLYFYDLAVLSGYRLKALAGAANTSTGRALWRFPSAAFILRASRIRFEDGQPSSIVRLMKFRTIWNVLLVGLGIIVCVLSAPYMVAQLKMVMRDGWTADPLALTWLLDMVGLLIFEVLFLLSLGSWTWNLVGRKMRWFFASATALLLVGTSVAATVDYMELHSLVFDYVKFSIWVVAMSFPIVFLRTGYIGLLVKLWVRRSDKSVVA